LPNPPTGSSGWKGTVTAAKLTSCNIKVYQRKSRHINDTLDAVLSMADSVGIDQIAEGLSDGQKLECDVRYPTRLPLSRLRLPWRSSSPMGWRTRSMGQRRSSLQCKTVLSSTVGGSF
jgi:hypothetical protein